MAARLELDRLPRGKLECRQGAHLHHPALHRHLVDLDAAGQGRTRLDQAKRLARGERHEGAGDALLRDRGADPGVLDLDLGQGGAGSERQRAAAARRARDSACRHCRRLPRRRRDPDQREVDFLGVSSRSPSSQCCAWQWSSSASGLLRRGRLLRRPISSPAAPCRRPAAPRTGRSRSPACGSSPSCPSRRSSACRACARASPSRLSPPPSCHTLPSDAPRCRGMKRETPGTSRAAPS